MSANKKLIREQFRKDVFERDGNKCRVCGSTDQLDAHHITDRSLMPKGGYVKENGVTLCASCHKKAEEFHKTGKEVLGFEIDTLYNMIQSSVKLAWNESLKSK